MSFHTEHLHKRISELEAKLEAMREWANLNYIKPGRSKQVQRLFDILEAEG